jgi:DNA polymerase III subunit gamma/tau
MLRLLMEEIDSITQKNIDIRRLTNDLMELLKESVIYAYTKDAKLLIKLTVDEAKTLNAIPPAIALKMIDDLMETAEKYRSASDVLSYFEIGLLKLIGRLAPSSLTPVVETGLVSQPVLSEIQKLPVKRQPVRKTEETTTLPIDQPTTSVENEPTESEPVIAVVVEGDQAILNLGEPEPSDRGRLETTELSSEFLIQLLVNAEKQLRISDAEAWKNTSALALESNFMKSLTLIAESVIQASGEQFVLLSFDNPLRVHAINDVKNITEFAELSERLLKRKVRLFAISNADFEVVKSEFMRQLKGGILPNKAEMDLFPHKKARKKQTDPLIDKVGNLFGEENMVVVGGEES